MLTKEQKAALDDMVERRMKNTGETREEAAEAIAGVLKRMASDFADGGSWGVVDDNGKLIGRRDAKGYHPFN